MEHWRWYRVGWLALEMIWFEWLEPDIKDHSKQLINNHLRKLNLMIRSRISISRATIGLDRMWSVVCLCVNVCVYVCRGGATQRKAMWTILQLSYCVRWIPIIASMQIVDLASIVISFHGWESVIIYAYYKCHSKGQCATISEIPYWFASSKIV